MNVKTITDRASRLFFLFLLLAYLVPGYADDTPETDQESRAAVAQADELLGAGQWRSAEIVLKNVLRTAPDDVAARMALARVSIASGRPADAIQQIDRASAAGAPSELWALDMIESLMLQRRYDDAQAAFKDLSPRRSARAMALQGELALRQRDLDTAKAVLLPALDKYPKDPAVRYSAINLMLAQEKRQEATEALDALIADEPGYADALMARAALYREANQREQEVVVLKAAVASVPEHPRARTALAASLIAIGRHEEAQQQLDALERLFPGLPAVAYLRGLIAYIEGDFAAATGYLEQVVNAMPNHPQARLLLGSSAFALENFEIAAEHLRLAGLADPDNEALRRLHAAALIKARDPDAAIELLTESDSMLEADVLEMLGHAYLSKGSHGEGAEYLLQAVAARDEEAGPALRLRLAQSALLSGNAEQALSQLSFAASDGEDLALIGALTTIAALYQSGEVEKALQQAGELEQRYPETALSYNAHGLLLLAAGKSEQARQRFERAVALDQALMTAQLGLVQVDAVQQGLGAAAERLTMLLREQGEQPILLAALADIAEGRGDAEGAGVWLQRAVTAAPESVTLSKRLIQWYVNNGDDQAAYDQALRLAELVPKDPGALELLARAQIRVGEAAEARWTLDKLGHLERDPAYSDSSVGYLQLELGDFAGAAEAFRRAIHDQKGDSTSAWLGLAESLLGQGRTEDMREALEQLEASGPVRANIALARARLLLRGGDESAAVQVLEDANARWPEDRDTVRALAATYARAARAEDEIRLLSSWFSAHPADGEAGLLLANRHEAQGQFDAALSVYEQLLAQASSGQAAVADALNNMALLLLRMGNLERAVAIAEKATRAAPNDPNVADTLGWVRFRSGDVEGAIDVLRGAYDAQPSQPVFALHYATALAAWGRVRESSLLLNQLLVEHPYFEQKDEVVALLRQLRSP